MKKYLIASVGVSAVFTLLWIFDNHLPWQFHQYFIWFVVFFLFQSILISWLLYMGEKDKKQFPIFVLGSVVLRFVSAALFLLIFFIAGLEDPRSLVIQFMALYLTHMVFELSVVLSNLRPN
ncbi:MAG: hypothetical protein JXQ90_11100 [Cyclobacteriaceae bacterium]